MMVVFDGCLQILLRCIKVFSFFVYVMDEVYGMFAYIAINSWLLSWESHHWGRFAFRLVSNLRVPLLGQVCHLQPCYAGTGLFMQLLARVCYSLHGLQSYATKSDA